MGTSTNGQICFGIPYEEDFPFPWLDEKWSDNPETWWIEEVCGFKPSVEIFDAEGNFLEGFHEGHPDVAKYTEERRAFEKAHPLPVEVVNYCSGDCPMYMIAVKSSLLENRRGYPEEVEPEKLKVTEEERNALIAFCGKYCVPSEEDREYYKLPDLTPKWYLSSYWG